MDKCDHQQQRVEVVDDKNIVPTPTASKQDPSKMTTTKSSSIATIATSQSATPPVAVEAPQAAGLIATHSKSNQNQSHHFLDDIIVGYAFGPKKMETMGLIMAEASKSLSTVECSATSSTSMVAERMIQQKEQQELVLLDEESMATSVTSYTHDAAGCVCASSLMKTSQASRTPTITTATNTSHYFSDDDEEEEDTRSWSSTRSSQHLRVMGGGGGECSLSSGGNGNSIHGGINRGRIQLTFLTDENGAIHLVKRGSHSGESSSGGCGTTTTRGDEGDTTTGTSVVTPSLATTKTGTSTSSSSASSSLMMLLSSSSCTDILNGGLRCSDHDIIRRQHPIRVSFVPIDLDTPLEEQHGGKFDVILHKLTEEILCMSKMLQNKDLHIAENDERLDNECTDVVMDDNDGEDSYPLESTSSSIKMMMMSRRQARASERIQRLRDYKHKIYPSCVLVDSPNNILAVMSRAEMAEVLSQCLDGVTTRGGIPVRTPRFIVVEDDDEDRAMIERDSLPPTTTTSKMIRHTRPALADEIDSSGFEYPLIAKPLTAAGTKSSHHMGIVLARDGLQRLKTPCLLQEFANHGEKLFKVYVLGESVWVFARESLPNLPLGEKCDVGLMQGVHSREVVEGGRRWLSPTNARESYVEFERPAGSNCYVEFNSQRPYPKLSDFGIVSNTKKYDTSSFSEQGLMETVASPIRQRQRQDDSLLDPYNDEDGVRHQLSTPTKGLNADCSMSNGDSDDLAIFVTNEELEPVTNAIRDAFGLKLFGFDVIVKHDQNYSVAGGGSEGREILVVDVNYFPGYKEVPNFPSLLAQYLTQKAVESRIRNFDGS